MKRALMAMFLLMVIIPVGSSFAQTQDKPPTLGIEFTSFTPFHYKAADGSTIIIGEVQSKVNFPVTGIKIEAHFFDDVSLNPLESTVGTTLLEVIPPNGKSPYVIKSPSTNAAITNVSVNLLGFNSATEKQELLSMEAGPLEITDRISFSGTISNISGVVSENTRVHLVFYDSFIPPRLIGASTVEVGNIEANSSTQFSFEEKRSEQASGFMIFGESDNFTANVLDMAIIPPELISKRITINDVSINDSQGNRLSNARLNSPVYFESTITSQSLLEENFSEMPYVYYVQIIQSQQVGDQTKSFVEFIGTFESNFDEPGFQKPIVEWIPEKTGLYFAETYVWDPNGIALASQGPITLVLVN